MSGWAAAAAFAGVLAVSSAAAAFAELLAVSSATMVESDALSFIVDSKLSAIWNDDVGEYCVVMEWCCC